MKGSRVMATLGLAAILAGCGQVQPPQGATPVHFTVLTKHGGLRSGIFAATTVDDLRSQAVTPGQTIRACTGADESSCLATFDEPAGSLLVGVQPAACADNHLDAAYLEHGTLTFVINWTNRCPPGAGTVAIPEDWVVAVPLHPLPRGLLPLRLELSNNGGTPEQAARGLVDLRPAGPGHSRTGNISLDTAPLVAKGQAEHITLTIFGLVAVRAYDPWGIDIAAVDGAGRVVWHQGLVEDSKTFTCLVTDANRCTVGSYAVDMPTSVLPGRYEIRPSFVLPPGSVGLPQPPPRPPFNLPSASVEIGG